MRDAIDTTTLGWIKPELDETLLQARQEIEAYSEAPDARHMRACAGHLHQVHGTLRMVELYAPAMVAEEMERLALALVHGEIADRDDACAMLMRGAVQLPDYLERLQGGHRDIPIVLLPLLNELRATRGEPGLNESVLFAPNLDRPLPGDLPAPPAAAEPARFGAPRAGSANLSALRQALAQWPESGAPADAAHLAEVVDGLLAEVSVEPLRRMLWVASSVAGALRDGALPPTRALRLAFSGVEREARQMLDDNGFSAPSTEPNAEPTRQLLYHVAHSDGGHPALESLRRTFELDAELPSESEIEHARGSLSGRNRALLDTVSAAIKEDLLRVKDVLDLHLRSGKSDVDELRPQVEALGRVSDTLGMMGLGIARGVVLQQRDVMHEIVAGRRPADESALLDIAGALLYVDASLDEQVARLGLPDDRADEDMLASESRKVLEVVVREAIANFGDARQSFVAFVETNWDHAELVEVPRLLEEVTGALRILDLDLPADYLHGVKAYTEIELIARKRVPNTKQLDTMADALASVEYYLEALRERRPNRDRILEIARHSLEALGYWPLPGENDLVPGQAPSPVSFEDQDNAAAALDMGPAVTEIATALEASPAVPEAAPAAADASIVEPFAAAVVNADGAPVAATPEPVAPSAGLGGFEHSDDIDDEIREVFLEELEEEIGNLGQMLIAWRQAPEQAEQVRSIRRVFHTLKGSGRLVGAKVLGEFSWKIENMLNRVLDGTRPATPAVVELVEHAHAVLPQLHAALQANALVSADLASLEQAAERVATGEEFRYVPPAPVASEAATVEPVVVADVAIAAFATAASDDAPAAADDAEEAGIPASVDAVLLEILGTEVTGHLATIDRWLADSRVEPGPADDQLQRAIHTLNGAFAMTEVPVITDITMPTEAYVRRLLSAGGPASAEGVAGIAAVAAAVSRTLAALQSPAPRIPEFIGLAERMLALRDSLPLARPIAVDEFDVPLPAVKTSGLSVVDLTPYAGGELDDAAAERVEAERLEAERLEAERLEVERLEAERVDAERVETERLESERVEAERVETERLESERVEAERLEAERLEAERVEIERLEAERLEAERLEAEEAAEYARLEAEYAETDRLDREQAEAAHQAALAASVVESANIQASGPDTAAELAAAPDVADIALVANASADGIDPDEPLDLSELDVELVEIFVEEGRDLLDHSDGLLADLRVSPDERQPLIGLQRDLHTLKGGARMAGLWPVGELGHAMESLLEAVVDHRCELGRDGIPLLERGFDRLHGMLTRVGELRAIAMPEALIAEFDARSRTGLSDTDDSPRVPSAFDTVPAFAGDESDEAGFANALGDDVETFDVDGRDAAPTPADDDIGATEPLVDSALDASEQRSAADMETAVAAEPAPVDSDTGVDSAAEDDVAEGDVAEGDVAEGEMVAAEADPAPAHGESAAVADDSMSVDAGAVDDVDEPEVKVASDRGIGADFEIAADSVLESESAESEAAAAEAEAGSGAAADATADDDLASSSDWQGGEALPVAVSLAPKIDLPPLSAPISFEVAEDEHGSIRAPQEQVRIRADLLDRLVNYAGEVAIYRARLEQQLGMFRSAIGEMAATNTRMRDQLRRLEIETEAQIVARYQRESEEGDQAFDPLELDRFSNLQQLSRALSESAADQGSLQLTLDDLTRQYETLLLQQSRVSSDLQEGLMRTRMVPFDGLLPRLRRVIRQASGELGKQSQLELDGSQGELDRNVLERMTAPLEHMLRNAIAHGLESPAERRQAGKPEEGVIRIAVRREGSEVVLEVADDGRGLDRAAIRRRGEERGLVRSDAVMSDAELDTLIMEPGFSTADSVSQLAGRGVGMDVVASEVRQLGGTIEIRSQTGKGTTFVLRLPQTLAVTQAVFVRIGETTFAVPIASVRGVGRISREQFERGASTYEYGGDDYAVHDLGTLVGHAPAKAEGQLQVPLLLIRAGDLHAAVAVDQVVGNREIVVKPIGPQVASIPGIFGGTIMGDGRVVMILDVAPLVRRQASLPRGHVPAPVAIVEHRQVPLVMVVDDSVTMRKVTGRILERQNFEVATAKDGVDALERMVDVVPDLMLLDIEMPRMDGYELATLMKADPRLQNVPIVMITSRTGDKHRQRAMDIGVNRYLGKPYQEPELLRTVYDLLGIERHVSD